MLSTGLRITALRHSVMVSGRLFRRGGYIACALTLWFPGLAAPAVRAVGDLDRMVAVVNDDVITETELATHLDQTKRQLAVEKIAVPPDDVLRKQLLERLVLDRLQLQLADRAGIRV